MRKFILTLSILLLTSCFEGDDGRNGISGYNGYNGSDGLNYYSFEELVNIQEIVGDGVRERFEAPEGDYYQLPGEIEDLVVDNPYSECQLQDTSIIFETDTEIIRFVFEPTENRYRMKYKSGPVEKVVDSSILNVYYEESPVVICDGEEIRLHSGVTFNIRVIRTLEVK